MLMCGWRYWRERRRVVSNRGNVFLLFSKWTTSSRSAFAENRSIFVVFPGGRALNSSTNRFDREGSSMLFSTFFLRFNDHTRQASSIQWSITSIIDISFFVEFLPCRREKLKSILLCFFQMLSDQWREYFFVLCYSSFMFDSIEPVRSNFESWKHRTSFVTFTNAICSTWRVAFVIVRRRSIVKNVSLLNPSLKRLSILNVTYVIEKNSIHITGLARLIGFAPISLQLYLQDDPQEEK